MAPNHIEPILTKSGEGVESSARDDGIDSKNVLDPIRIIWSVASKAEVWSKFEVSWFEMQINLKARIKFD